MQQCADFLSISDQVWPTGPGLWATGPGVSQREVKSAPRSEDEQPHAEVATLRRGSTKQVFGFGNLWRSIKWMATLLTLLKNQDPISVFSVCRVRFLGFIAPPVLWWAFSRSLNTKHPLNGSWEVVCFWFQLHGNQTPHQKGRQETSSTTLFCQSLQLARVQSLLLSAALRDTFTANQVRKSRKPSEHRFILCWKNSHLFRFPLP